MLNNIHQQINAATERDKRRRGRRRRGTCSINSRNRTHLERAKRATYARGQLPPTSCSTSPTRRLCVSRAQPRVVQSFGRRHPSTRVLLPSPNKDDDISETRRLMAGITGTRQSWREPLRSMICMTGAGGSLVLTALTVLTLTTRGVRPTETQQ